MFDVLNQRLARIAEQKARLEKLRRRTGELEREQREAAATVERLRRVLEKEERDVEALEGSSLSSLFASVLGSRDERLWKERQEAVAAALKHDEARLHLEELVREQAEVRHELARLEGTEEAYQALLAEKERAIQTSQSGGAGELMRLADQEQQIHWQLKQLQEAKQAGLQADAALLRLANLLQSAQNWGAWDMLGGKLVATAVKHSRLGQARREIHATQEALTRFQRELKDVQAELKLPNLHLDAITKFADFFFDNLLVDWAVQHRINKSLQTTFTSRQQVATLLKWLDQQTNAGEAGLQRVREARARFVESYRVR